MPDNSLLAIYGCCAMILLPAASQVFLIFGIAQFIIALNKRSEKPLGQFVGPILMIVLGVIGLTIIIRFLFM